MTTMLNNLFERRFITTTIIMMMMEILTDRLAT